MDQRGGRKVRPRGREREREFTLLSTLPLPARSALLATEPYVSLLSARAATWTSGNSMFSDNWYGYILFLRHCCSFDTAAVHFLVRTAVFGTNFSVLRTSHITHVCCCILCVDCSFLLSPAVSFTNQRQRVAMLMSLFSSALVRKRAECFGFFARCHSVFGYFVYIFSGIIDDQSSGGATASTLVCRCLKVELET